MLKKLSLGLPLVVFCFACTNRTVSIFKVDPVVEFETAEQVVQESDGRITIPIKLNRLSEKLVIINYQIEAPSGLIGGTFHKGGSLSFPVGISSGSFHIQITDNKARDQQRNIKVTLTEGKNAKLGYQKVHLIKVIDDD